MSLLPRSSGVLAHLTVLPGEHGVGTMGACADEFLDFLVSAGQSLWQMLPLTPTGYQNSPYSAPSAFAGNSLLIALEPLRDVGLLTDGDLHELAELPYDRVDFARLIPLKEQALRRAFQNLRAQRWGDWHQRLQTFREAESAWLEDFALFVALREARGADWTAWEAELRDRDPDALQRAREDLSTEVEFQVFTQMLFFSQWEDLRQRARDRGIQLIGDVPIFVAHDSADVWAHRSLFKLDREGKPPVVAGVPPDYFSQTGQRWGNPLYDWDTQALDDYAWWSQRFAQLLRLVDIVRIDHFRGFEAAWEVPASEATAVNGTWVEGPEEGVFEGVSHALRGPVPVIAEDLGSIGPEVRALLERTGFPGMKVLQFAFGGDAGNPYLPHNFLNPNCVVYTGTHDNDTTRGWFASSPEDLRAHVTAYLGTDGQDIAWDLIRAAEASVANTAIIPLQDVLELGSEARMNTPGQSEGNWAWRCQPGQLEEGPARRLLSLTSLYGRGPVTREGESAPGQ